MSRPMLQAKVNPKFLHSNSTSHTWPFSAVAELIDNAYDPDVLASDLWIDYTKINGKPCLVFLDNGAGMDLQHLQQMLGFGYCEKEKYETETASFTPIGHYGNGFKSGSMRLAKDALVLTVHKASDTACIGFLSQSLCAARNLATLILPLMEFVLPDFRRSDNVEINMDDSLEAILETSPYSKQEELIEELRKLSEQKKQGGTKIVLFGLKRNSNGMTELDFESSQDDIRNPETHEQSHGAIQQESQVWEYRQSLRKYCSILYQKPRMKIFIRGTKVGHFLIQQNLKKTQSYTYKPKGSEKGAKITFGRIGSKLRLEDFGILFYHCNRLIQPYIKIGNMKENDDAKTVVGIVDVTHVLQPIHNKQAFQENTIAYRSTIKALLAKLAAYLDNRPVEDDEQDERAIWDWVQCDRCNKWRRLPAFADVSDVPKNWYCYMNPDQSRNRCDFDEEETADEYDILGSNRAKHGARTPKAIRGGKTRGTGSKNRARSTSQPSDHTDPGTERKKRKLSACQEQREERRGWGGIKEELDMGIEPNEASNATDKPAASGGMDTPAASGGMDTPAASGGMDTPAASGGMDTPAASGGIPATSGGTQAASDTAACLDLSDHKSIVEPYNDVSGQEAMQPARSLFQSTPSPELAVKQNWKLEDVVTRLRSGVEALLPQTEEDEPLPLMCSSAQRLTRPALDRVRQRSTRLSMPFSSHAERKLVTPRNRSISLAPNNERSWVEQHVGQPACCAVLRRRLHRFLTTFLQVKGMWKAGEVESEDNVEAMLQRAMELLGLDPE